MTKIIGIDDSGRGPVLGPMILAGVLIEEKDNSILKEWGAKDSKLLTPKIRKEVKEKIINKFKYHIEQTEPIEIDESDNLNYLEAIKAAKIINKLTEDLNERVNVIIDCPSVNIKSWTQDVQRLIKNPKIVSLACEHKADANHPSVSAASIVAKERREDEVYRLKRKLKIDFGSGYPSDPKTKEFIAENFNNPKYKSIIRFSWKTVKKLFEAIDQEKLF
ncbi:MAG: ribonuclease HII [Nanoarchaeota archaeon]|nr:ribonuclease HII [Nanoarchaeota archaeon]